MNAKARIVKVDVRQGEAGMAFAAVHGRPSLFLSADSMDDLPAALAAALENAFAYEVGEAVFAVETDTSTDDGQVWVILPVSEMRRRLSDDNASFSWLDQFQSSSRGIETMAPIAFRNGALAGRMLPPRGSLD